LRNRNLAAQLVSWLTSMSASRKSCLREESARRISTNMIIAVVNSKGGVGKSTIAGSLAGWLHAHQRLVALADCDSQQSSSGWLADTGRTFPVVRMTSADQVLDELPALAQQADFVIADGPGSQTEVSRALLMWADLAIVPCKASMFEARALAINTNFVRQAQAIRQGPPAAVTVLSMVGRDFRLTRDMIEAARSLQFAVAETALTLRQAYADAPGQGTFVWEMGYAARDAANEMDRLFRELLPEVACAPLVTSRSRIHMSVDSPPEEKLLQWNADR
jgi:chromosome partitioning protein